MRAAAAWAIARPYSAHALSEASGPGVAAASTFEARTSVLAEDGASPTSAEGGAPTAAVRAAVLAEDGASPTSAEGGAPPAAEDGASPTRAEGGAPTAAVRAGASNPGGGPTLVSCSGCAGVVCHPPAPAPGLAVDEAELAGGPSVTMKAVIGITPARGPSTGTSGSVK